MSDENVASELKAIKELKRVLADNIKEKNPFLEEDEPDSKKIDRFIKQLERYNSLVAKEEEYWGKF